MANCHLEPPLVPRRGGVLRAIGITRISTVNQNPKSLADQEALLRGWVADRFDGLVEYGGHGLHDHLLCRGGYEYRCWNGIMVDGPLAARKLSAAASGSSSRQSHLPGQAWTFRFTAEDLRSEREV
jgi:hypothetical protein